MKISFRNQRRHSPALLNSVYAYEYISVTNLYSMHSLVYLRLIVYEIGYKFDYWSLAGLKLHMLGSARFASRVVDIGVDTGV